MVSLFANEMKQLSLAANVVSPELLGDIGDVLGRYIMNSLHAGTYEVRTSADFIELKQHLEALFGRPVDLATPEALHHRLRERILAEAVYA